MEHDCLSFNYVQFPHSQIFISAADKKGDFVWVQIISK